ncbi:MAG: 5-oxoprolinase subunit PxpA [Thermoleophilia bacterium]|nr:5-oxoprolinase subunit PxpA [Thermoleophilia bacterium]
MERRAIDINCDLGESFGNWSMGDDAAVLPEITTANVACGFHAGDPVTLMRTVALALENDVAVGAHPGLPDLLGFGRRKLAVTPEDAAAYVVYQVGAVREALRLLGGGELHHVKPHGAFLDVMRYGEPEVGHAVAEAIASCDNEILIYWPSPTEDDPFSDRARELGLRVIGEIYPDLAYDDQGRLILERQKKHVASENAAEQLRLFLQSGTVRTSTGDTLRIDAESVSVHGDGPNAADIVAELRRVTIELGHEIRAVPREVTS